MCLEDDIERFYRYVEVLPSGCHFWTGARSRGKGNCKWCGSFHYEGRAIRAHRFADDIVAGRGPLPKGMHRGHACEFSLCVNLEHLERVTHAENERRRHERKRLRRVVMEENDRLVQRLETAAREAEYRWRLGRPAHWNLPALDDHLLFKDAAEALKKLKSERVGEV